MPPQIPVSVIIAHYNRSDRIGAALASINQQTCRPLEVIVVDDASRDEHRSNLKEFASAARILYLDRNGGPAQARNAGIEAAHGEFLAFLDDDDEWFPTKLETQW